MFRHDASAWLLSPLQLPRQPRHRWDAESASNRIKSLAAASYDWCTGQADLTLFIIQVVEHREVATAGKRTDWTRAGNLAGVSQVNCAISRHRVSAATCGFGATPR